VFDSDISDIQSNALTRSARPVMTIDSISWITVSRALSTVGACALTKSSDKRGSVSTPASSSSKADLGCSSTSNDQHLDRLQHVPSSATLSAAFANSRSFSPSPAPLSACLTRSICTSSLLATSTNRAARRVKSEACASTCRRRTKIDSCSWGTWIF